MTLQTFFGALFSLETVYVLTGAVLFIFAILNFRDKTNKRRATSALFWLLLGVVFMFGSLLPHAVTGLIILMMVALDGLGRVTHGTDYGDASVRVTLERQATREQQATNQEANPISANQTINDVEFAPRLVSGKRITGGGPPGKLIFLPVLMIPLTTILFAVVFKYLALDMNRGVLIGLGFGGVFAGLLAMRLTQTNFVELAQQGRALNDRIGTLSILPQLLASLGVIFAASKIGDLIARSITTIVPADNLFLIIVANCLGMALFTMLMGNSFAAFPVIAAGVLVPLIIVPFGANPAAVAILTLTAGSTGTLMTPMAANFNIVPTALLEMKDTYGVIKFQIPFALAIWLLHVLLMWLAVKFL